MNQFEGKITIITGAGSGIGRAVAETGGPGSGPGSGRYQRNAGRGRCGKTRGKRTLGHGRAPGRDRCGRC